MPRLANTDFVPDEPAVSGDGLAAHNTRAPARNPTEPPAPIRQSRAHAEYGAVTVRGVSPVELSGEEWRQPIEAATDPAVRYCRVAHEDTSFS